MLHANGKIKKAQKSRTALIYVPSTLVTDFLFPFKELPASVSITIDGEKLVVEKTEKTSEEEVEK